MKYEEKLLKYLVENYRKSKKDSGDNKINRRTQIKPEKLYKKYNANDGDFEEISKLNQTVEQLSNFGFISSERETFGTQIQCIYLMDQNIRDIERYLADKYGYVSKDSQIEKLKNLISKYQNASPICEKECGRLCECIEARKIPQNIDELDDILKAIAFIETNQEDLYIREVSMKVYGDSKFFENTTLQSVCNMLRRNSNRAFEEDEKLDEILLDYHIAKEPQKLCIKGRAIINISGKEVDISGFSEGVEFLASDLVNVESIKLIASKFMTIENRTSYLRYHNDNVVAFYLGGYANRYQRDFIKRVYADNITAIYLHFGDIDAGGLWIHQNLCEITGVSFDLFGMSVDELSNDDYVSCLHKLTDNDKTRLQELKQYGIYADVIQYMLENNVKLEQEIVSLGLMERK